MEERWIEIKFCWYIKRLLNAFNRSLATLDFIEVISVLAEADPLVIKKLVIQIRQNDGIINTNKLESVFFARKYGLTFRELLRMSGIIIRTQYILMDRLKEKDYKFDTQGTRVTPYENEQVKRFVNTFERLCDIPCKR